MRGRFLATVLAITALSATAGAQQPPAGDNDDPWPGYVPGGRYYRSIEFGVSFWGPGQADQQFQASTEGVLVSYSIRAAKGRPWWVVKVVASNVKQELAAKELLAQSANQLRQVLADRVSNIQTAPADESKGGLVLGRLSCQIAPERPGPGAQPIHRVYVYLRLRLKQYLTLVGETSPAGADTLGGVLDTLAGSVRIFDPQQEGRRITEAADRMAALLGKIKPADWSALAARYPAHWLRDFYLPPPAAGKADANSEPPRPVACGWAYHAVVARSDSEIEAVSSVRTARDGASLASYQSAWVNLATGEEVVRDWNRTTPPQGAAAAPIEVSLVARRKAAPAGTPLVGAVQAGVVQFDVTVKVSGQADHSYVAKHPGGLYLPAALAELIHPRAVDQAGAMFGAFSFSPGQGQVVFQTLQMMGPGSLEQDGKTVRGVEWRTRSSISMPLLVLLTDPTGTRVLRLGPSPDNWADGVNESDVPADLRRELPRPPNWP